MKKYRYNINNLDCPNCARKIEDKLNKEKRLKNVVLNFNTAKISYETTDNISITEINEIIKTIESNVFISEEEIEVKKEFHLSVLILGVVIGIIAHFINIEFIKNILLVISYTLLLYRTSINAYKLLFKSKTINENMLITISCLGALFIGEHLEGIMVITLYTIGKLLEEKAINNSRKSIKNLIDIKQLYANKKDGNKIDKVLVDEVKKGDILIVKKGERIPVDAEIIKGNTKLDTSALTGESEFLIVKEGDSVLSSSINMENIIEIKATSVFSNSMVSKVLELLDEATDKKTKTETIVSKVSKIYTPCVLIMAILISIVFPLIFNISYSDSIYRGLTFLVISCPCAIAISIPLSYFTGIGISSKNGILIKGSNYLDNLSNIKNIIFDKTGTLTNGSFEVTNIEILNDKYSKEEIIDILVKGESLSNHPIAKSIMKLTNKKIDNSEVKKYKEIIGKGISYELDSKKIVVGNKDSCKCDFDAILHLNIDGIHVASITITDGIKENSKDVIEILTKQGIKTYMFTGDKKDIAYEIGKRIGISDIKYEMLPTDKYYNYEKIKQSNEITVFVGDGINDAPVLKRADIGISMGNIGSEVAIESSDIVLMKDDLNKIPLAIKISKYTKNIIKQNLIFSVAIKLLILIFSIFGYANMWLAVFADTGVTLITIINTLRIMNKFK